MIGRVKSEAEKHSQKNWQKSDIILAEGVFFSGGNGSGKNEQSMTLNIQRGPCSTLPHTACYYSPQVSLILDLQQRDRLQFMSGWDSNHLLFIMTSAGLLG